MGGLATMTKRKMLLILVPLNLFGLVIMVGVFVVLPYWMYRDHRAFRSIYEKVDPVIERCKALDDKGIVIRGKVMVFDFRGCKNVRKGLEGDTIWAGFDDVSIGCPSDPELTVFVVRTTRLKWTGYYRVTTVNKVKAFRGQHDVYAIAYPSLEPLGSMQFECDPPPPSKYLRHYTIGTTDDAFTEVVGNPLEVMSRLRSLPGESGQRAKARRTSVH